MKINLGHLKIAKNIAIVLLISISILKLLYSLFYFKETLLIITVRTLSVFIFLLLGYLTYKDRIVPSIIMVIFLLLFGLWSIVIGVFIAKVTTILGIAMIMVGCLFVFGGLSIITIVMKKNNCN